MSKARKNAEENVPKRIVGRPFEKGNPGRPKGSRHKTTIAMEALLDGEAEGLTRKCVEAAMEGDMTAMRLCMERLYPPVKDKPVRLAIPKVDSADRVTEAMAKLLETVAAGDMTPAEAKDLAGILDNQRRALDLIEMDKRMAAIEDALRKGGKL